MEELIDKWQDVYDTADEQYIKTLVDEFLDDLRELNRRGK